MMYGEECSVFHYIVNLGRSFREFSDIVVRSCVFYLEFFPTKITLFSGKVGVVVFFYN